MAFVDDDIAQVAQHPRPPNMVAEDRNMQHIGVGKHPTGVVADGAPGVLRGVAVVKRNQRAQRRRCHRACSVQLIGAQRLGRGEVQRGGRGGGGQFCEHGQQVAERFTRRRARRDDAVHALAGEVRGCCLMSPQVLNSAIYQHFFQPIRHPLRPRCGHASARRKIRNVRHRRPRMRTNNRPQQLPSK